MFKVGDHVAYGLHGKCEITGITTKELNNTKVSFYQIRQIKNPIAAKVVNPSDASILIPVDSAQANGLRSLMTKEDAQKALHLLSNEEWHFDMNDNWVTKQKKFEECIRKEGYIGLAKVVGHLYIQLKKEAVPASNVQKFYEQVQKVFCKELAEALNLDSLKDAEALVTKALKSKLSANN